MRNAKLWAASACLLGCLLAGCEGDGSVDPQGNGNTNPNNNNNNVYSKLIVDGNAPATFTFGANYNGVQPPVAADDLISGYYVANSTTSSPRNSFTMALSQTVSTSASAIRIRALAIGAIAPVGENLPVGTVIPLAVNNTSTGCFISLSDTTTNPQTGVSTFNAAWAPDGGTTGNLTITAVNSTGIEFDYEFNDVGPNTAAQGSSAVGTFSVQGHWFGSFVPLNP